MNPAHNYVEDNVFRFLVNLEVQKAIRLQYCISIVCLAPDLTAGTTDPSQLRHIAQAALRSLRATDVATTVSVDSTRCVALLLIDAEPRSLRPIVNRVTAVRAPVERAEEERLSWSAGGGSYPQTVTGGEELLRQALDLMTRANADGGNRFYLPS